VTRHPKAALVTAFLALAAACSVKYERARPGAGDAGASEAGAPIRDAAPAPAAGASAPTGGTGGVIYQPVGGVGGFLDAGAVPPSAGESGSGVDASVGGTTESGGASASTGGSGGAAAGGAGAGGSPSACAPTAETICDGLVPMPTSPVIDGRVDCGLSLQGFTPLGWSGAGSVPAGRAARWAAAYRPDGLYLFVAVTTGALAPFGSDGTKFHCGDAVELFVDADGSYASPPSYDPTGSIQLVVQAPGPGEASRKAGWRWRTGVSQGAWSGTFVSVPTADGYAVEAFVRAADLGLASWSLAPGGHVGVTLAIDVAGPPSPDPACPRAGQYAATLAPSGACVYPWCNVGAFCRPTLR
jgi:hypothetical protein